MVSEHALITFFRMRPQWVLQTKSCKMWPTLQPSFQQNLSHFVQEVQRRERSWTGQPRRRICSNMPKLWHPVESCSMWFSADTMLRKSLQCIHAHTTHSSRLSHGKRATQQSCSAAIGWEEDQVSQPTYTRCFQESLRLGPLCRTSAFCYNLLWQGDVMLDTDLQPNLKLLI